MLLACDDLGGHGDDMQVVCGRSLAEFMAQPGRSRAPVLPLPSQIAATRMQTIVIISPE
jgi:hypothetical protein